MHILLNGPEKNYLCVGVRLGKHLQVLPAENVRCGVNMGIFFLWFHSYSINLKLCSKT